MRTEHEILKDFEELGFTNIDNDETYLFISNYKGDFVIEIDKEEKTFIIPSLNMNTYYSKLLHELFECWGWL